MCQQQNKGLGLAELLNSAERCGVNVDENLYFYLISKLFPESIFDRPPFIQVDEAEDSL